jgi:hypothetical protein
MYRNSDRKSRASVTVVIALFAVMAAGCRKEEPPAPLPASRTVIVYLAADNDLSGDALVDLEEMRRGYTETGNNLVVLADVAGEAPYLLQITGAGGKRVKTYPEFNSADADRLRDALSEIIELYPADRYGLILWSHGNSWLPAGRQLKAFTEDGGRQIINRLTAVANVERSGYLLPAFGFAQARMNNPGFFDFFCFY